MTATLIHCRSYKLAGSSSHVPGRRCPLGSKNQGARLLSRGTKATPVWVGTHLVFFF